VNAFISTVVFGHTQTKDIINDKINKHTNINKVNSGQYALLALITTTLKEEGERLPSVLCLRHLKTNSYHIHIIPLIRNIYELY